MKQKFDWAKIKLDYFADERDEVKMVVGGLLGGWKKSYERPTKGWAKEKKEYKERVIKRILDKKEKEDAKSLAIPIGELKKAKKASLKLVMKKISDIIKNNEEINIKDIEKMLKMIKTELGEPTNITKNENTNINTDQLSEEDEGLLEKIFGNKNGNKSNGKNERETI